MDDPRRLIDDPTASPLMRSLLATAGGDEPSARDRGRVVTRLGAAGIVVAATGKSVSAALIIGLIVAATTIGVVTVKLVNTPATETSSVVSTVASPAPARATVAAPSTAPTAAVAASAPAHTSDHAAPQTGNGRATRESISNRASPARITTSPQPPAPPTPDERAPVALAPPPTPETHEHAANAPSAPTQDEIDARRLAAEVALLDRARKALRNGDTTGALAALDEHATQFADGALAPEADVIRIDALVAAGHRDDARALATAFLTRYPKSPLAPRVRAMFP